MRALLGSTAAFAVTLAIVFGSYEAQAKEIDPLTLAACMQSKVTADEEVIFRNLMIYAFQDKEEELRNEFAKFASLILRLAAVECKIPVSQLQSQNAEKAFGLFGENLARSIMAGAMAKLGV